MGLACTTGANVKYQIKIKPGKSIEDVLAIVQKIKDFHPNAEIIVEVEV